jgi:hypothetical protein
MRPRNHRFSSPLVWTLYSGPDVKLACCPSVRVRKGTLHQQTCYMPLATCLAWFFIITHQKVVACFSRSCIYVSLVPHTPNKYQLFEYEHMEYVLAVSHSKTWRTREEPFGICHILFSDVVVRISCDNLL